MKVFKIVTNKPFSDYYENFVLANNEKEAKNLVYKIFKEIPDPEKDKYKRLYNIDLPPLKEKEDVILKVVEIISEPSILYHDCIHYT